MRSAPKFLAFAFGLAAAMPASSLAQSECADGTLTSATGTIEYALQEKAGNGTDEWLIVPRGTPRSECRIEALYANGILPAGCTEGSRFRATGEFVDGIAYEFEFDYGLQVDRIECSGGGGGGPPETFTFNVCNRDGETAWVAVAYRVAPGSRDFYVEGWWPVEAGACTAIGQFPSGWFYYYAYSRSGSWPGSSPTCVTFNRFRRVHYADSGYTCDGDELKNFREAEVDTAEYTWHLDP